MFPIYYSVYKMIYCKIVMSMHLFGLVISNIYNVYIRYNYNNYRFSISYIIYTPYKDIYFTYFLIYTHMFNYFTDIYLYYN